MLIRRLTAFFRKSAFIDECIIDECTCDCDIAVPSVCLSVRLSDTQCCVKSSRRNSLTARQSVILSFSEQSLLRNKDKATLKRGFKIPVCSKNIAISLNKSQFLANGAR